MWLKHLIWIYIYVVQSIILLFTCRVVFDFLSGCQNYSDSFSSNANKPLINPFIILFYISNEQYRKHSGDASSRFSRLKSPTSSLVIHHNQSSSLVHITSIFCKPISSLSSIWNDLTEFSTNVARKGFWSNVLTVVVTCGTVLQRKDSPVREANSAEEVDATLMSVHETGWNSWGSSGKTHLQTPLQLTNGRVCLIRTKTEEALVVMCPTSPCQDLLPGNQRRHQEVTGPWQKTVQYMFPINLHEVLNFFLLKCLIVGVRSTSLNQWKTVSAFLSRQKVITDTNDEFVKGFRFSTGFRFSKIQANPNPACAAVFIDVYHQICQCFSKCKWFNNVTFKQGAKSRLWTYLCVWFGGTRLITGFLFAHRCSRLCLSPTRLCMCHRRNWRKSDWSVRCSFEWISLRRLE